MAFAHSNLDSRVICHTVFTEGSLKINLYLSSEKEDLLLRNLGSQRVRVGGGADVVHILYTEGSRFLGTIKM
jgi:hypothetical protein